MDEIVKPTLALYDAHVTDNGFIRKGEKTTGVRVAATAKRIQFRNGMGHLIASCPPTAEGVCKFVESFWFWNKCK